MIGEEGTEDRGGIVEIEGTGMIEIDETDTVKDPIQGTDLETESTKASIVGEETRIATEATLKREGS